MQVENVTEFSMFFIKMPKEIWLHFVLLVLLIYFFTFKYQINYLFCQFVYFLTKFYLQTVLEPHGLIMCILPFFIRKSLYFLCF